MPGSETGVMTSREPFSVQGLQQKTAVQSQPFIQNMRLDFSADSAALYKPITTATSPSAASPTYQPGGGEGSAGEAVVSPHGINVNMGGGSGGESMKRKRGRPRKYGPDGTMALALASAAQPITATGGSFSSPPAQTQSLVSPLPPGSDIGVVGAAGVVAPPPVTLGGSVSPTGVKKARGRPPGSRKKQQLNALGSAGFGFTPHVITVKAGEDISSKIMSFSQHGPRAVSILSANGAISNVTLRQQATSGGTVTYEGKFEILVHFLVYCYQENGVVRNRSGGLSVCLSGPDGRVLGGSVAGLLVAAAPVQVVVGSFVANGRKESKSANHKQPSSATSRLPPRGGSAGVSTAPITGDSQ
uniref:AT-hook motif nuclear-localized protein n=1 Tax=Salix viminalis TaxID=40686 RepID=A0A6N2LG13_SALVM